MAIEAVTGVRATIGESPTWVAEEGALYWIDVKAPALHRLHPATGETRRWTLTSDVGGFAFLPDGGALVALRRGLHRLDLGSGELMPLAPPPFDPALFRFNEGACDADGRFWIGVMFDPVDGDAGEPREARLHSFTTAGGLREEPDASDLHNGMAWSADGGTFYLSHSNAGEILAFDYDAGHLAGRRVFARVPAEDGIPDGAAVDTDGGYWCALHGGGRLRRFHADGSVDRDLALPVSQPTMPLFAGAGAADLYVTSAADGLTDEQKRAEPLAGRLLTAASGARGVARHHRVA